MHRDQWLTMLLFSKFVTLLVIMRLLFSSCLDSQAYRLLPPWPSVINPCRYFTKRNNWKGLHQERWTWSKETKNTGREFWPSCKWSYNRISCLLGRLTQLWVKRLWKCREKNLVKADSLPKGDSTCDQKDEDVPGEEPAKVFAVKKLSWC